MMGRITSRFSPAAGPGGDVASTSCVREALGRGVTLVAAATLAVAMPSPNAARAAESGVSLQDGWMRTLIRSRPAAGYFLLRNTTATPKVLIGAASPACGQLTLHQSLDQSGQHRMVAVRQVDVPAHGSLSFAPGNYHLMCMEPGKALKPGGSVKVTLDFADGGTLAADFAVRGSAAQ